VGKLVCKGLKEADVEYKWDGNPDQCVEVISW
jgi:hypothetical protein